ncbi:competence/damage-inducible protein A [soil metagenome]
MHPSSSYIGLLATGEELIQGDILNTNGQFIARQLADQGFTIGSHVIVGDGEAHISAALHFLLQRHQIVIITGGLGPTSDDRTRFALSSACGIPLVLDESSWQAIVARINRFGLELHASNKQQALFPQDAEILANPHGTAAGCKLTYQNKTIYMLPGPPRECLPMFRQVVLPELLQLGIQHDHYYKKWRLFSVNESEIAAKLDTLVAPYCATTGYRWDYPYLEFKLQAPVTVDIAALVQAVEAMIAPHVICNAEYTAADMLKKTLENYPGKLIINDAATGGLLQATLLTPTTRHCLNFITQSEQKQPSSNLLIELRGLNEFWQGKPMEGETLLEMTFISATKEELVKKVVPYRSSAVIQYAVEYACYEILLHL